ncbi:MAG: WYL domain-containing protein [Eubacterium sp.]|nr:WYL domain-containing protein [Eubacterium sp.]
MAAAGENQKLKLLYLYDILKERTDEDHAITMGEIIKALDAYGVKAERKSIYTDIQALNQYGADIVGEKDGRGYNYRLASRDFELAELKLLVDAVQSSRFVTTRKSGELIRKLEGLASSHEAKKLDRQVVVAGRIKTMNESIYYNVDAIHRAIGDDVQIHFKYFRWTPQKEQELRHDGEDYVVSPWGLVWDDENYYLIGYDAKYAEIRHYRVDKMKNIRLTENRREGKTAFRDRDLGTYTEKRFGMYGGELMKVTLQCKNEAAGVIIDRFGKDVPMIKLDKDHFETKVDMAMSELFLGWIASMSDIIRITEPKTAVDQMKNMINKLKTLYDDDPA